MRVLIAHGYGLEGSGSSIYTRNLAHALLTLGHQVVLLAQRSRGDARSIGELEAKGATVRYLDTEALATTYRRAEFPGAPLVRDLSEGELRLISASVERSVADEIRRSRPDIVIANHFLHCAHGAVAAASAAGIVNMVVSHGTDIEYACAVSTAARALGQETFERATYRVALNTIARDRIAKVLLQRPTEMHIMPPGIDVTTFSGAADPRPSRVVQVGRLLLDKGPHLSIAAVCLALPEMPNLELVLVGDGPDRALLEQMVGALDRGDFESASAAIDALATTEERTKWLLPVRHALFSTTSRERLSSIVGRLGRAIRFAGYQSAPEVATWMASSRLALLPSMVPECYPLTLLEAMASGCAIHASPLGGTSVILQEHGATLGGRPELRLERPIMSLMNALRATMDRWTPELGGRLTARIHDRHDWRRVASDLCLVAQPDAGRRSQHA